MFKIYHEIICLFSAVIFRLLSVVCIHLSPMPSMSLYSVSNKTFIELQNCRGLCMFKFNGLKMIDHLRSIDTFQSVLNFDAGVDADTNAWTN